MAMPVIPEARRYTVQEVLDFPDDGNRYEVVQGELLVSPAPRHRHQIILARLFIRLQGYLEGLGISDSVLWSPADITWGKHPRDAEDLVQPDLFVPDPDKPGKEWLDIARLELAVEALSPSSLRADRVVKRKTYQRHGVKTYWVIDDDAKLVEVWRPGDERPEIITDLLTWKVREDAPELRVPLAELLG
jgi:Uma2 family endonuclease